MKKSTKILLSILIIFVAAVGFIAFWQKDNIYALYNGMTKTSEDLETQMDGTRAKLKTEVEKHTTSIITDLTAEDEQKLLKGELTLEEVAEKYNLPIEYMKDDYQPGKTGGIDRTSNTNNKETGTDKNNQQDTTKTIPA